jgi:hypothetical protein
MHVHGAKRRSVEVAGRAGEVLVISDAAVFEKGVRDRNSPMCTLSQNCYGAWRVKARKYTCFLTLANTTASHECARGEEKKRRGYGASRRSVGHQ